MLFVATRLWSMSVGFTPAGNSTVTIPSASALLSTIFAAPPSAVNLFASVLWNGVTLVSGTGTHMAVAPTGLRTSTCVVTSNVRHPLAKVSSANKRAVSGKTRPPDRMLADRRKSRRFMEPSFYLSKSELPMLDDIRVPVVCKWLAGIFVFSGQSQILHPLGSLALIAEDICYKT